MITNASNGKLIPSIGFWGLLAMCVGLNIGGSLFALTSLAAGLSGPSLPIAMMISALPALLAVLPYSILTSSLPTTSATYRYAQMVHPTLALVVMLSLGITILIGAQPLFGLAFGSFLKHIAPVHPITVGVIVLTVFYFINLIGINLTARIQIAMFCILMAALVIYIVMGIPHVAASNFNPLYPMGAGGVFAAAGLLYTFCTGGFFVIDLGGEVIMARRIFPKVLLLGMVLVIVLYLLILVISVGVVPWGWLKGKSLIHVAEQFMPGPVLVFFVIGGALTACATTINVIFSIASRAVMVLAKEGLLPEVLGRVHPRFGTPHWGLTVGWLICVSALIFIPSLMFFGSMLNLGLILAITAVAAAGLILPSRYPAIFSNSSIKVPGWLLKAACIAIIAINALIFLFFCAAIGKASFVFFGIVLFSLAYAWVQRKKIQSLRTSLKTDPEKWFRNLRGENG